MTSLLSGLPCHLVRDNLLDAQTAEHALYQAKKQHISFVHYLVKNKILTAQQICQNCEKNFGLPVFDLKNFDVAWLRDSAIHPELIQRYRIIPLHKENNGLHLGITDPTDSTAIEIIRFHTGLKISPLLIADDQIDPLIERYGQQNSLHAQLQRTLLKTLPLDDKPFLQENVDQEDDEPIIDFANRLLQHAAQKSISDIHIEPYEHHCRIRFRRDGLLYEITQLPHHIAIRLTTRLKIMARLDIAERRLPQDGRFQHQQERNIDVRINTCPTLFGEKIVLRLLDSNKMTLDIDQLGFNAQQKQLFLEKISEPQGLILVTGPTGSGKTVTLYSALDYLNKAEKNISSVEDPIEIQLHGINQINIHPKIGLHFATVLRTLLRQDPDIIMVGEIRDAETANVAVQAAQTGHLVLSTLHTNSAYETITRLQSMGIATYNWVSAVSLIIAQRLVRQLCSHCQHLEISSQAQGCQHCHQGYQGRTGIFELLPITEKTARLVLSGTETAVVLAEAKADGFAALWEAGLEKVRQGITSLAEINRVLTK